MPETTPRTHIGKTTPSRRDAGKVVCDGVGNGDSTVPANAESVSRLKQCDSIRTYRSNGWWCADGYTAGRFITAVHFNSEADIVSALGPDALPPSTGDGKEVRR